VSRVLVTGAGGFIGRHVAGALIVAGHEVHGLARRAADGPPGVIWHDADLLQDPSAARAIGADTLVHLAWNAEHGRFWTAPENVRWVEASLALLRAFEAGGGTRAVMAGTCAEYAWDRAVYPEDAPRDPVTLYGAAKHGLHVVAGAYAEQQGLELAWGRLFFLYGPNEAPGRFVPSIVRALLAGESAPMTAGTQVRDFMHVADAGAAFAALAQSPLTGAVNIASGQGVPLRELAARIARQIGAESRLRVGALPTRGGDPPSLVADVTRLRDELGFTAAQDLASGLADTISWWRGR